MVVTCTTATGHASSDLMRVHSFQDEAVAKSFASDGKTSLGGMHGKCLRMDMTIAELA